LKDPTKTSKLKTLFAGNLQIAAIVILPLLIGILKPNFLTLVNLNNVLDLSSILIIAALGFTFIVECGAIDLSVEANMALAGVVMAKILQAYPWSGFLAILAGILVSAFCGFLNGIIYTKFKIPSFLTTLGMAYISTGICTVITEGQYVDIVDPGVRKIAIGRLGGMDAIIPNTLLIAAVAAVIIWFLSEKRKHGRYVLAVGGDELIAKDLGIRVDRVKIVSFTVAGAAFGLAGTLLALKLAAGDSFSAVGYTFETISACVIGGIAISGGIGKMYKAILGAVIITIIRVGMVFFVVPSNVQAGILGVIVILTVAATIDRSKLSIIK
jgi:ribose/xylose/arabinose/galactoside ABC-type transport system permease subunit